MKLFYHSYVSERADGYGVACRSIGCVADNDGSDHVGSAGNTCEFYCMICSRNGTTAHDEIPGNSIDVICRVSRIVGRAAPVGISGSAES